MFSVLYTGEQSLSKVLENNCKQYLAHLVCFVVEQVGWLNFLSSSRVLHITQTEMCLRPVELYLTIVAFVDRHTEFPFPSPSMSSSLVECTTRYSNVDTTGIATAEPGGVSSGADGVGCTLRGQTVNVMFLKWLENCIMTSGWFNLNELRPNDSFSSSRDP